MVENYLDFALGIFLAIGVFIQVVFSVAWFLAGFGRYREYRRVLRNRSKAAAAASAPAPTSKGKHPSPPPYPGLTVVMPVKDVRPHAEEYWLSQVRCKYSGPLEFLFVVDFESDRAYATLRSIADRVRKEDGEGAASIRVLVAGPAVSSSQKIQNMVTGFRAANPSHKYLIFFDDDIVLHQGSFEVLVDPLEADKKAFMTTGYPFDVPVGECGVASYGALSFHLPLNIPFSVLETGPFVWGGCQVFRLDDLRKDTVGIIAGWLDGGYSDDLITAAICDEKGLKILFPKSAVFPQFVAPLKFNRFWNYLHRQTFVLDTYASPHNRTVNFTLYCVHCVLSWTFVWSELIFLTILVRGVVAAAAAGLASIGGRGALLSALADTGSWAAAEPQGALRWLLSALSAAIGAGRGPGAAATAGPGIAELSAAAAAARAAFWSSSRHIPMSLRAVVTSILLSYSQRCMTWSTVSLMKALSPGLTKLSIGSFNFLRLWCGFFLMNALLPLCATYAFISDEVDWSGIRYKKRNGKVVAIDHGRGFVPVPRAGRGADSAEGKGAGLNGGVDGGNVKGKGGAQNGSGNGIHGGGAAQGAGRANGNGTPAGNGGEDGQMHGGTAANSKGENGGPRSQNGGAGRRLRSSGRE